MTYDANGNIATMNQRGLKINSSPLIDQLTYTYQSNSNKLSKVADAANDNTSKLGDFKYDPLTKGSTDYTYDVNGNLIADANKKISSITYNHLNLPSVISITGKGTITYTYDAAGKKHKKITVENASSANNYITTTTTTTYISGMVYESKTDNNPETTDYTEVLQFVPHEEGRIRFKPAEGAIPASFAYYYFIKDHLGNVRMVLTEEQRTDPYPAATMETAQAATEEALYANVNTTRVTKPSGYPTDNYTNPNNEVAKVNGSGNKVGPSIVLKVMAGDKFNLRVSSWYKTNGSNPGTPVNPLNDLLAILINGVSGASGGKITGTELTSSGVLTPSVTNFLNTRSVNTAKPKAYLNWVLVDEQFKLVSSSSSAEQVGDNEEFKIHTKSNLPIDKNGYLYVYVSNETPNIDVFFDNLQVTHIKGPILEETHYYPFGLTMAGISSKAAGKLQNNIGITGKEIQNREFTDGSGLRLYDFGARLQDPQLGRWHSIDPMVSNYYWLSPYNYCNNNPIKFLDPNGMEFVDTVIGGKRGRYDVATLVNVTISLGSTNSAANAAFPWVSGATSSRAKNWLHRKDVYIQARMNGWSQQAMSDSWAGKGISGNDLDKYELGYNSEVSYRNSQLIVVGILGAPLVATTAPGLFVGTMSARISSVTSEIASQYITNVPQYGIGLNNLNNFNLSSLTSSLIMPKSPLGSAVFGNLFKFTGENGYTGVSSNASGSNILTNIGLNYLGNKVGEVHGNFLGNMLGNSSQIVSDIYYNLNK